MLFYSFDDSELFIYEVMYMESIYNQFISYVYNIIYNLIQYMI